MPARVRLATAADVAACVALGEQMHAESPRFRRHPWDAGKVHVLAAQLVDDGVFVVAEQDDRIVGFALGVVVEHFFSRARMACDLAVYVSPLARYSGTATRLLRAFESRARELGAAELVIGVTTGSAFTKATSDFYSRLGLPRVGAVHIKDLA